jgi:hypothetical protein
MHVKPKHESGNICVCDQVARIDDWMGRIHTTAREPRLSPRQVVFVMASGATAFFLVGMLLARLVMT